MDASSDGGELPPPPRPTDRDGRPIPLVRPGDTLPSLPRTPAGQPPAFERPIELSGVRPVGRMAPARTRRPVWYVVGVVLVAAVCVGAWFGFRELVYGDDPADPPVTVVP